jgi:hypothetical protein
MAMMGVIIPMMKTEINFSLMKEIVGLLRKSKYIQQKRK